MIILVKDQINGNLYRLDDKNKLPKRLKKVMKLAGRNVYINGDTKLLDSFDRFEMYTEKSYHGKLRWGHKNHEQG